MAFSVYALVDVQYGFPVGSNDLLQPELVGHGGVAVYGPVGAVFKKIVGAVVPPVQKLYPVPVLRGEILEAIVHAPGAALVQTGQADVALAVFGHVIKPLPGGHGPVVQLVILGDIVPGEDVEIYVLIGVVEQVLHPGEEDAGQEQDKAEPGPLAPQQVQTVGHEQGYAGKTEVEMPPAVIHQGPAGYAHQQGHQGAAAHHQQEKQGVKVLKALSALHPFPQGGQAPAETQGGQKAHEQGGGHEYELGKIAPGQLSVPGAAYLPGKEYLPIPAGEVHGIVKAVLKEAHRVAPHRRGEGVVQQAEGQDGRRHYNKAPPVPQPFQGEINDVEQPAYSEKEYADYLGVCRQGRKQRKEKGVQKPAAFYGPHGKAAAVHKQGKEHHVLVVVVALRKKAGHYKKDQGAQQGQAAVPEELRHQQVKGYDGRKAEGKGVVVVGYGHAGVIVVPAEEAGLENVQGKGIVGPLAVVPLHVGADGIQAHALIGINHLGILAQKSVGIGPYILLEYPYLMGLVPAHGIIGGDRKPGKEHEQQKQGCKEPESPVRPGGAGNGFTQHMYPPFKKLRESNDFCKIVLVCSSSIILTA